LVWTIFIEVIAGLLCRERARATTMAVAVTTESHRSKGEQSDTTGDL
jgi:hypothetical protein